MFTVSNHNVAHKQNCEIFILCRKVSDFWEVVLQDNSVWLNIRAASERPSTKVEKIKLEISIPKPYLSFWLWKVTAFWFLSLWIPSTTTGCLPPFSVWGMSSYWAFLPHLQKYSKVLGMLGQLPFPSASPCQLDSFSPVNMGVSQPHEICSSVLNTGVANTCHHMSSCQASSKFLSIFLCSGIAFHGAP